MEQCKIDRINELTKISRERELTAEETAERQILRREYVDACKASLKAHLGSIKFVDETGKN